jgi:hypothetical protein
MSLRLLGCALLLVVLAAFKLPVRSTGQEPVNSNQAIKWEYRVLKFEGYQCVADNAASLNRAGHEGWELVSYAPISVAFPKEAEGTLLIRPAATGPGKEHTPQTADSFTGTMTMKMAQSHLEGCQMIFKRLWHPTPEQPQ